MLVQNQITNEQIQELRNNKIIEENETVIFEGDLLVATNVLTGEKRIINSDGILRENNKRVLKG
jgi:hypothetical protein